MAENASLISLATFDTTKTSASKDAGTSRFRTSAGSGFSSALNGKGGFEGFLKTFLGDDEAESGNHVGLSRGRNVSQAQSQKSSFAEKCKLSTSKSGVSSEEDIDIEGDTSEAEMMDAARYAWEIICDQLNAMSSLDNVTAGILDSSWLQDAMISTNTNSMVNNAAVFSVVEDLIGEMTDDELSQALAQGLAQHDTVDMDAFNRMASELNARVVAINDQEDLLASLAGTSFHNQATISTGTENSAGSAENSGKFADTLDVLENGSEFFEEFSRFIEEKMNEDPTFFAGLESTEQVNTWIESFSKWLSDNDNIKDSKGISEHPNKFIQSLISGISSVDSGSEVNNSAEKGMNEVFSKIKSKLEALLQDNAGMKANETNGLSFGQELKKLNQGIFEEVTESGVPEGDTHNAHGIVSNGHYNTIPSLARSDSTNPAAMSSMLDQIENIERIAEAVKMSNRTGVKNLTMQLTPDELGKVVLKVESRDGVVNAYLRVERPEAVAQLGQSLTQLRENLKAAGVELGELTIEQRGFDEMLGDFSGNRQGGRNAEDSNRNRVHWSREREGADASSLASQESQSSGRNPLGALNFLA